MMQQSTKQVRPLPEAAEAEEAVLGCLLREPVSLFEIAFLKPHHFSLERNHLLYAVLCEMAERKEPIDLLTVTHHFQTSGHLDDIGGANFLTTLANAVPSALHVRRYAEIVVVTWLRRQTIVLASELAELGYAHGDLTAEQLVAEAYALLAKLEVPQNRQGRSVGQALQEFLPTLESYLAEKRTTWGTPTQFKGLDAMTGGLQPGELWTLAADPGMGKSALLLNILLNVAQQGFPAVLFSLEMVRSQILLRLLADVGNLDTRAIQSGALSEAEQARLYEAARWMEQVPLTIFDGPLSTWEIRAALAKMGPQAPKAVGIDYSLLLRDEGENEVLRIANISRACKNLATEFQTTVILIHPTNDSAAREGRPPRLNELSWGRRMQYDADFVFSPWFDAKRRVKGALISVLKQRSGEGNGTIEMTFDRKRTRWSDA